MENMEQTTQTEQTEQVQQKPQPTQARKEDTSMDPVVIFGGAVMFIIGIMMVVKGVLVYVPALGLHGVPFPVVGLIVMVAGVFFFTMPRRRKKKEQAKREAAEQK